MGGGVPLRSKSLSLSAVVSWISLTEHCALLSEQNQVIFVVFCLADLVENFDEASKNEANWFSFYFFCPLGQPFSVFNFNFFLTSHSLTRGTSLCEGTVVKGAVHHLQRREPFRVSLQPQQHYDTHTHLSSDFTSRWYCGHSICNSQHPKDSQ